MPQLAVNMNIGSVINIFVNKKIVEIKAARSIAKMLQSI
jgi:hypothetical protein